jgi:hypothetical protein
VTKRIAQLLIVVLLVAVLSLLAACGDDEADPTDEPAPSAASTAMEEPAGLSTDAACRT